MAAIFPSGSETSRNACMVLISMIRENPCPGQSLFIQDGLDAITILSRDAEPLKAGDRIEAVGLPGRDDGLFAAFCEYFDQGRCPVPWWLKGLRDEVRKLRGDRVGALDCIRQSLEALGVAAEETDAFLSATLLALRGWRRRPVAPRAPRA